MTMQRFGRTEHAPTSWTQCGCRRFCRVITSARNSDTTRSFRSGSSQLDSDGRPAPKGAVNDAETPAADLVADVELVERDLKRGVRRGDASLGRR